MPEDNALAALSDPALTFASLYAPDKHPAKVYLARLSKGSRRSMKIALEAIAICVFSDSPQWDQFPWHELRYQHVQAIRTRLLEKYKPAGVNKCLSALRGVLKEAWKLGYIDAETYHRAVDVPNVKSETLPSGRSLSHGEITKLFAACSEDRQNVGVRDQAILATSYGTGMRRAEVVGLDLGDFDADNGSLRVRNGKGGKERLVYLPAGARAALEAWLEIRGDEEGPLFVPIRKGGALQRRRLTTQAIYEVIGKRAAQAKIKDITPHDLRRTFITHMLDAGADLSLVSALAGHKNLQTTKRYDMRGEAEKQKAVGLLHVPFEKAA